MIRRLALATLFLGTACSAQPQGQSATDAASGAAGQAFVPPQPASASQPVPRNAPLDTAIVNVPATDGKANLPATAGPFTVEKIGQFEEPFGMEFLPGGSLLVTEKAGTLKLRHADGSVVTVSGVPKVEAGGQGGLLDVAIAPDFADSKHVYLTYSEPGEKGSALALARGTLVAPNPAHAALRHVSVIWRSGSNGPGGHFGARIAFSPDGQHLFLSAGERQRFSPAQDPDQLLGKILRLTLDGKAAPGNPMYAAGGVRAMTWSMGHRNPYGLAFAPDGRLWETEMGPKGGDELNLIEPGKNYGWPVVSNGDNYSDQPIPDHPSKPEFEAPKLWWNPSISPGGMIIYTGDMFPQYKGSAFLAALSAQALVRVDLSGDAPRPAEQWDMGARIRDVIQAPDGAIWLLQDDGALERLTPKG
ncbi:PQQ-dependent sugar dehydrogenase [Hephaestia sp. GCM10023244]|uniref:PQQ-dependent sugar dehydrogenase n=1 Tax=unclassified Hephaestia TaxID=2631281 RepID=UPI0020772869|nr:PQQ-dependent sugar dehydrogenase [Hephaestia sp. MAHUQ-44]MCM8731862.1 PQQ-dependent sugar dehydrogenase [Hephaestia sp. MAHUQ-44]